ncbi:hypothetical protein RAA17_03510 [Komagataeibacter rhaeticus]|nr:hypothetical protein [Komagataeibacter rhaeticus]
MMLGFLLLVDSGGEAGRGMTLRAMAAGFVMVAGLTFKHNILALPAATFVWLVLTDWRRAIAWLSGCLLAFCLLGGLFYAAFGPDFVHGVFGHKRLFHVHGMLKGMGNVLGLAGMGVSCLFLRRMRLAHGYGLLVGVYCSLRPLPPSCSAWAWACRIMPVSRRWSRPPCARALPYRI